MESQNAKVVLKPGELLNLKDLREAVKKADFTSGDIHIKVAGKLGKTTQAEIISFAELALKTPDTGQTFLLVAPAAQKSKDQKKPSNRLPELRNKFETGQRRVMVSGRVHQHKNFTLGLTVEEFVEEEEK